jgi:hypothetical protein
MAEAAVVFLLPDLAAVLSFAGRMLIFSGITDVFSRIGAVGRPVRPLKFAFTRAHDATP